MHVLAINSSGTRSTDLPFGCANNTNVVDMLEDAVLAIQSHQVGPLAFAMHALRPLYS